MFYYEDAENVWLPAKMFDPELLGENLEHDEEESVRFKLCEMTQEEFDNLPDDL